VSFVIYHMTASHTFAELYQEKVTPEVLREMDLKVGWQSNLKKE